MLEKYNLHIKVEKITEFQHHLFVYVKSTSKSYVEKR